MTIRVLELAEQLKVGTDDLLAVCTLLEIPATSRISCLSPVHIKKLRDYYIEQLNKNDVLNERIRKGYPSF